MPAVRVAPADLLIDPSGLPPGFGPVSLPITELTESNGSQLAAARSATVVPDRCRPSADADLNHRLSEVNAAVLGARSGAGTLVEVVTTETRDITADITASTGECAHTRTTIRQGSLAGATIDTVFTPLPNPPRADTATIEQMLTVRSDTTTTLPDGGVATRISYSGYATLTRPGVTAPITVMLTASGAVTEVAAPPAPAPAARAPMQSEDFVTLFGSAVNKAVDARPAG